jgi:hypothetical protein
LDHVRHLFLHIIFLVFNHFLFFKDLRVEWLKCRARASRWKEEIQLVEEEMRRSLEFGRWLASWWMQRASIRTGIMSHLQEGLIAYAAEKADREYRRILLWEMSWASIRERAEMVLKRNLNDKNGEGGIPMPKLTVEIEIELDDEQDLFDKLSDTE